MEMNLADMLSYADIHDLGRIAHTYECECNGHSKNELIQSILSTAMRKDIFEKHIQSLSSENIRFLNSLLSDPRNAFSMEELIARAQQSRFQKEESSESWNPRDMILNFKKLGWLFNGYSQQTKYLFHVPSDLKRRFSDVLANQFKQALVKTEEPEIYRDEQVLLAHDVFHFLTAVAQQEMPLTAEGFLYKRQLGQIITLLSVQENMVPKGTWRFGYGRMFKEYPNRFSLIYDYCYYHEFISEHDLVLRLTEVGKARLMEGKKESIADIYSFWLRLYKTPIPNIQSIAGWMDRLCDQWVTMASIVELLSQLVKPFYYDSSASIVEQRIIQMMMHMGLIRIGEDHSHGAVIQVTKLGSKVIRGINIAEDDKVVLI
ncbi:hypothetical protein [Paenibacillus qinlingensis]|uniref:Helicase XPB/Ssl2 N-terminal domain-containing protein n=1 Tax=Paenibacillus qinlingensis TaxID=1837343 RepID=A0ABU1NPT7_9BACL|nr:hypothetical protein [Paenibacillus qinlingensis]MDR6549489.1 hypothetical protein [Paenibacillus qinlingensis]